MTMTATKPAGAGMNRGVGRPATACTMPNQAHALNRPATAAIGRRKAGGLTESRAPSMLRTRNDSPTQPTVRSGGMCRHHPRSTAPWWTSTITARAPGTAMKKSQEIDTTAIPNSSATHGESRTAATMTNAALLASVCRRGGASSSSGHDARTMKAVIAVRTTTKAANSSMRPTHDRW